MIGVAKTLKQHWDGILHGVRACISNGILKAIKSFVAAAKANVLRYRTTRNLITMVYRTTDKFELPTTHLT